MYQKSCTLFLPYWEEMIKKKPNTLWDLNLQHLFTRLVLYHWATTSYLKIEVLIIKLSQSWGGETMKNRLELVWMDFAATLFQRWFEQLVRGNKDLMWEDKAPLCMLTPLLQPASLWTQKKKYRTLQKSISKLFFTFGWKCSSHSKLT